MHLLSISVRTLALASLSSFVCASTYVVDDQPGPGVDFTDLPAAIAFAQAGDVLLIAPGSYSGFVLDKGLALIGSSSSIGGPIRIENVPSGWRAAVVGLHAPSLIVDACDAAVLVQDVTGLATAHVTGSRDVRIARTNVTSTAQDALDAFVIDASRVELVDSNVHGHPGIPSGVAAQNGVRGGAGIVLGAQARLVASGLDVRGGAGTLETTALSYAGGGGDALELAATSNGLVLLGPASQAIGGTPGSNWFYDDDCEFDTPGGSAVFGGGPSAALLSSGTTFSTWTAPYFSACLSYTPPLVVGVTHTTVAPDDPSLRVVGTPSVGQALTFVVRGEPGATAKLVLARVLIVNATPGVDVEELVPSTRTFSLGLIPPSGEVTRGLLVPTAPAGFTFAAQAEVIGSNGVRRTNSTPVIVR